MKRYLTSFLAVLALVVGVSLAVPSAVSLAQSTADYSCGTYGAGDYSQGGNCDAVSAPDTGFAAAFATLTQPSIAIPLGLSILAIIIGLALLIKKRRHA
jgi:uncharacterized membrane protein